VIWGFEVFLRFSERLVSLLDEAAVAIPPLGLGLRHHWRHKSDVSHMRNAGAVAGIVSGVVGGVVSMSIIGSLARIAKAHSIEILAVPASL